ncbi:MAG TPA: 4Fe-4S binding protein [Anaerolineales bacterium]|nr:4Fe-4S binding protein [Anaerolineales bacterium]
MNAGDKLSRTRTWMMISAVFGSTLIGLRHIIPGEESTGGSFDAFCPFGAIETFYKYVTTGTTLQTTNLMNFAIFAGVLSVSLIAGRAFCGWMCPVGSVQEWLAMLSRKLSGEKKHIRGKKVNFAFPRKLNPTADKYLRYAKYFILAVILWVSTFSLYPPLHNICPARALFSLQINEGLLVSVLIVFILTSMAIERVWCKYLCPFGAFLAIFNKIAPLKLQVDTTRCNSCGRCDIECSMGIENVPENLSDLECIRCLECLNTCSRDDSLNLVVLKSENKKPLS